MRSIGVTPLRRFHVTSRSSSNILVFMSHSARQFNQFAYMCSFSVTEGGGAVGLLGNTLK